MIDRLVSLTDSEITKFSDMMINYNKLYLFTIRPSYENHASYPAIAFYNIPTSTGSFYTIPASPTSRYYVDTTSRIKEPNIEQSFHFSISDDKVDKFFEIFNTISKSNIQNKYYNGNDLKDIKFIDSIIKSKIITNHNLYDRKYTRYEYNFEGGVIAIIIYIKYLEDTIEYLKLIYDYNEKGEEVNLLKHKIGDIVCLKKDRSVDFLITDYVYVSSGIKYIIEYKLREILTDKASPIIEYGKCLVSNDNDLTYSRDSRINDILKKD